MGSKILQLKHAISLYAFLLIVWGFYRILFKLDDNFEELVLKPLIWLVPLLFIVRKEGLGLSSLGWTGKNLFKSIYIGLGLGIVFLIVGLVANLGKYGDLSFSDFGFNNPSVFFLAIAVSIVTAVSEETVFRGFLFNRIWKATGQELFANVITTAGWAAIHLPILIFLYKFGVGDILLRLGLTSVFAFGSAMIFARTGNIASSVLLHVFWSWPVILFR